jgi:hypothetical protein
MKRLIVLSLLMAVALLAGGFSASADAQSRGTDLKPTFISPTPGLYVHGWPPFTVSYPKEWVEVAPYPGQVYRAGGTRPGLPSGLHMPILGVAVIPMPLPLEDWARVFMPVLVQRCTDIKVISDEPSRLKDGTPAREVEIEYFVKYSSEMGKTTTAPKLIDYMLLTKRDVAWVWVSLTEEKAKFGEDLKKYVYSLTFQPGREEPLTVPPDVRAFLDMWCTDQVSGDVTAIMAHFSDRFLHSGANKAYFEQWFRNDPNFPPRGFVSPEAIVTVFDPRGDKAYVDGFMLWKAKGDVNAAKTPMVFQQIINEHGQWKWFGNQK